MDGVSPIGAGPARRSWRGVPSEQRAATRRELLIDSAFDLLGTEGWAAVTVRGVSRAARLHPRYFYQSFQDLDDLLVAVFDRLIVELQESMRAAVEQAEASAVARTHAGLAAVARLVAEDGRRARVLYTEALANHRINRRRVDAIQQFVAVLVPADDRPASAVAAHIAVGGFASALAAWLDGRLPVTLEELIDVSTTIVVAAERAVRTPGGSATSASTSTTRGTAPFSSRRGAGKASGAPV